MVVMVFGTFDILHAGHINFFHQAKERARKVAIKFREHKKKLKSKAIDLNLYPYLIVVIARDINVKKRKGHLPKFSEDIRLKNIKKLKIVDKAILGDKKDNFKVIKNEKPDIICLGYDQKIKISKLKERLKKIGLLKTKVFRLKPYKPQIYKSSKLLKKMLVNKIGLKN